MTKTAFFWFLYDKIDLKLESFPFESWGPGVLCLFVLIWSPWVLFDLPHQILALLADLW